MTVTAKLFKNGQSQAVRLPKEFRFENSDEVYIKKLGDKVILFPKNSKSVWQSLFESLDEFSDDFMTKREQPSQQREELFE